MKNINLFKILAGIIILSIIVFIAVVNIIEKTNSENKLYAEQIVYFKDYVSENLESEKAIELLERLNLYLEKNKNNPELIPMVQFYGKENDNHIILYTVKDEIQEENYSKELEKIISTIKEDDEYYVIFEYDDKDEYIIKMVIEYNY